MTPLAKLLIAGGIIMILVGLALSYGLKFPLGRLPGDFYFQKGNFSFYFPFVSGIIVSIILTIILNFLSK